VEIIDFLNLTLRRVVGLAVIGLLVAVPTTAFLLRDPANYRGTVTVRLSALLPDGGAFYLWERLTQDFETALHLPRVADEVARQAGVDADVVRAGLATVLPQNGDVVTVSFTGPDATRSLAVARSASTEALKVLTTQGVDEAAARVKVANQTFDDALQGFQTYVASSSDPDPVASAHSALTLLLRLKREAVTSGSPTATAQIASLETQLDTLVAVAPQYRQAIETAESARRAAQKATFDQVVATSQDAAAASGALVTPTGSTTVNRATSVLTTGLGVGAAAVMAVVAFVAAIELRRGRKIDQLAVLVHPQADGGAVGPTVEWRSYRRLSLSSVGERMGRLPPKVLELGWWFLAPIGFLASFGEIALLSSSKIVLALLIALPLGLAFTVLAVTRFEIFLIALIVVRASLDAFNLGTADGGSKGIDPGIVVGAVFIVCGSLWLLAQRRSGYWIKVSAPTWALWSFAGACVLSIPTSFAFAGSVISTTKAVAGVLVFSVLEQYLGRRPERARPLLIAMFASFAIPALVALKQWVSGEGNTYLVEVSRVTGPFVHPSSLANYLLILLPLSVLLVGWCRGRNRVLMVTITAVSAGLLIVTYTRAAWFGALVSIAYLAVRWRREVLYTLLASVAVLLIAVPSVASRFADLNAPPPATGVPSNSLSWRIGYWQRILPEAQVNPVTGIGFDAVQHVEAEELQPHNMFVQAYVETGLIGLASFLAIIWTFATMLRTRLRNASPGWPRLLALGATSVAIAIFVQFPSENLFAQSIVYTYLAVAMTYGIRFDGLESAPTGTDTAGERDHVGANA
jgi:O-antigen ligase